MCLSGKMRQTARHDYERGEEESHTDGHAVVEVHGADTGECSTDEELE
jgi:hypothetical protein